MCVHVAGAIPVNTSFSNINEIIQTMKSQNAVISRFYSTKVQVANAN